MINRISSKALKLLDASYAAKFILRLLAFYLLFKLINFLEVGITVPGGAYSAFIDHYLNYITWTKVSVLQTASVMGTLFGVSSHLIGADYIKVEGAGQLYMAWACCGFEIMSFWAAFALADTTPLRTKIYWCLGGIFCIWLINCFRVTLLLVAMHYKWNQLLPRLSHHDSFNIVAYGFVFLLMFVYYKKNKKQFGT